MSILKDNRRLYGIGLAGVVLAYIVDRLTKAWANTYLDDPIVLIKGLLEFSRYENHNIVFRFDPGTGVIIGIVLVVMTVVAGLCLREWKRSHVPEVIILVLILVGAFSNLLDRIQFGYVIDFVRIPFWSIFNLSDLYIIFGIIGYLTVQSRRDKKNKKVEKKSDTQ